MKWTFKLSAMGLLCCLINCGDADRKGAVSNDGSVLESSKPQLTPTVTTVKPILSESEIASQRDIRKRQQEIAKVAFAKIDATSTNSPGFAESVVSFWNDYQATASSSTRSYAIYAFNRLQELHPRYQNSEELEKLGLNLNSELVARGKIHRKKLWGERDAAALTEYAERFSKTESPMTVMGELWDVLDVDKDLDFAVNWLHTLPEYLAEPGWSSITILFEINDAEKLDIGLQMIEKLKPSIQKDVLLTSLLPKVLSIDPDAAAAWAKQLHQPGLESDFLKEIDQARLRLK